MKISKNFFFKILLIFFIFSVNLNAENRIDLDLRLEPLKKENFYLLKESFNNKKIIKLGEKDYKIVRSENELFVDEYYDTALHTLLKNEASIRYRKRFINNINSKNLIQFKIQKDVDKTSGMKEFKIEIDRDENLFSYDDFNNYINRPKNQNSKLYEILTNYVNPSVLISIFSVTQNRDRFYLQNKDDKTIFTISFDEVVFSKELLKKTYSVIEFEINETIMANSNKINSDILINSLNEFVKTLNEDNILFNRTLDSKYAIGIKKLAIKPKTENVVEIILIFFALFFIIILFCIPIFSRIISSLRSKNNNINFRSLK